MILNMIDRELYQREISIAILNIKKIENTHIDAFLFLI